ncbi:glycoside hydrolase family 28 protein [Halobium salinum]|uniref:Glycoside hydrolase family 28 protein n=1 Tax=Halobium salinum TaxID=1364940 RepID=A0ABD5PEZ4_9EURY|nr:glycoside hydrolase family 28 protein [Halobium salinum]
MTDSEHSEYSVTAFGASSGTNTEDTSAIQAAIDQCGDLGGGTVVFPPGEYVTAPVFLRDNITVRIEAGATVLGSLDIADYPATDGRWEGYEREVYASLFTGHDLSNVAITGRGTIDARGQPWWKAYEDASASHTLGRDNPYPAGLQLEYPRPRIVNLYSCENVLIEGVTIRNSPAWTLHFVYCEGVTVRDATIINPFDTPNTDGINPDSSRNISIYDCDISVGDDCIALKSGCDEQGRKIGEPCENVTISNCRMTGGYCGLAIGSETAGDIRNVTLSNCIFNRLLSGVRIKSKQGRGGIVENINVASTIFSQISQNAVELTMFFGGDDPAKPVDSDGTPTFDNFSFSDLIVDTVEHLIKVDGLPDSPIRRISFSGIRGKDIGSPGTIERAIDVRIMAELDNIEDLAVSESENVRVV